MPAKLPREAFDTHRYDSAFVNGSLHWLAKSDLANLTCISILEPSSLDHRKTYSGSYVERSVNASILARQQNFFDMPSSTIQIDISGPSMGGVYTAQHDVFLSSYVQTRNS
ncbi:hypothetical protein DKX38_000197 [Salix brachista]|uniref:Uncharacterized protein n=1 Tax=Salix brachista TaxID=2182728 RepID=A0A5N5P1P5_9ROSI|nr:hypothetical protein DKX38_000197 [Salix brachista]